MFNISNINDGNFGPDYPGKLVYNEEGINYFLATRLSDIAVSKGQQVHTAAACPMSMAHQREPEHLY